MLRLILLLVASPIVALAGCGDSPPVDNTRLVYWLFPNGSEVNLRLSTDEPQVPF